MLAFSAGMMIVSYSEMAKVNRWHSGTLFSNPGGVLNIIAFLNIIGTPILASVQYFWWAFIIVAIPGFILGFILTASLKKHSQIFSFCLLIASDLILIILNSSFGSV
jgi:hypothetical protein